VPDLRITGEQYLDQWSSKMAKVILRLTPDLEKMLSEVMGQVRQVISATAPVDTGALNRSWTPPALLGLLRVGVSTDRHYAPRLEYGGYTRTGPRTVALGGGNLGDGFVAGPGIYSTQAPLGFVRKALVRAAPVVRTRTMDVVAQIWKER